MSECEQTSRVGAYYDGEMAAGERAAMERHLAGCARCAGELARVRGLSALLGGVGLGEEVSAGAMKRFHATAVDAAGGSVRRLVGAVMAAAAAILIGCGAGLWAMDRPGRTSEAAPLWELSMMQKSGDVPGAAADDQTAAWIVEDLDREGGHESK